MTHIREPSTCRLPRSVWISPLGVFRCGAENFDAIGGTADIGWPPAPIASEAYDPSETLAVHCGSGFRPLPSSCFSEYYPLSCAWEPIMWRREFITLLG